MTVAFVAKEGVSIYSESRKYRDNWLIDNKRVKLLSPCPELLSRGTELIYELFVLVLIRGTSSHPLYFYIQFLGEFDGH